MKQINDKRGAKYIFALAGKNTRPLYGSMIFSILSGLCSFIPFIMAYQIIMFLVTGNGSIEIAIHYAVIAALALAGKFIFMVIALSLSHIGAFNTLYSVRSRLSKHISKINLGFFDSHTTGEIKKVVIEDVERIEKFMAHQIPDLIGAIVAPVIMFIYLLSLNIPMAFCMLTPVIIGAVIQFAAVKITGRRMTQYHHLLGKLNSAIMQFINGMPIMKIFNMTTKSYKEYSDAVTDYCSFWKQCSKDQGYTYGLFVALVESGIVFVSPIGGLLYAQGTLPLATYIFFMIMSMVFLSSLLNLLSFAQTFNQVMSGTARIKQIMDIPCESEGTKKLAQAKAQTLTFNDVSFSYGAAEVLHHIDIDMPAGSLTAFVGASGAGKTTAAQLIPKFWEVTNGSISISDTNIKELKNENLMQLVSFVFQETFMLDDTIYENIAIGKPNASKDDIEEAAKAAQIHDFILSLPNGYQTRIGEEGVKMSGGEKQRICIARAILKNAPIIVFDEATSYTDIENEYKIQLALAELLRGKTTIMIAHRLHTIIQADQICVFEKGHIIEKGTHFELLKQGGQYSKMWQAYTQDKQEVVS